MNTNNQVSASVTLSPADKRCRYWAKVVRAHTKLPPPSHVDGAADLPGGFLRPGEEELFPGDILIEGEANHHRRTDRGWSYWVSWCDAEGRHHRLSNPDAGCKARLKAAGLDSALLAGAGTLAACVRIAHAVRSGLWARAVTVSSNNDNNQEG